MPAGIRSMLERISLPPRGDRFKRSLSNPSIFDVLGNSIRIMEAQITETRFKIEPPDILIRPRLRNVLMFDFHRAKEIIAEGRAAARATLETLRT